MRLVRLLTVLEEVIAFVVLAGGSTAQALDDTSNILLENYVLDTLLMNPKKWQEVRSKIPRDVHLEPNLYL